jgi:hypothetical protein
LPARGRETVFRKELQTGERAADLETGLKLTKQFISIFMFQAA